ncbi:MAG: hypothetical protein PHN72_05905 [Bacilli bacterium]|nr:hypothetical protein [Bacilli bacterium]
MNKKVNKEGIVRNILIGLTLGSLIITALLLPNIIYANNYDTTNLNQMLVSPIFNILLFTDNILVYLFGITYIVLGIKSKQEVLLKVSFSIFSILTTIIMLTFIVNFVAECFGIF